MNIIRRFFSFFKVNFKRSKVNKRKVIDKKKMGTSSSSSSSVSTVKNMKEAKEKAKRLGQASPTKTLTVEQLIERIRNNIFFLENLTVSLKNFPQYLKYQNKVEDLKKQSEDSLRIVLRIDRKAAYYQTTMKSIVIHTNHIARVVNIPY